MSEKLSAGNHVFNLTTSHYKTKCLDGSDFHVSEGCLKKKWSAHKVVMNQKTVNVLPGIVPFEDANTKEYSIYSERDFLDFYGKWALNTAVLYRGIAGCHFTWEDLRNKTLKSEGTNDVPMFTMGNSAPTRWLPCTVDPMMASGIAMGCLKMDEFPSQYRKLLINQNIIVGVVVKIEVGANKNIPLSWLNPGEIVVRGPLKQPEFTLHQVVTLSGNPPRIMKVSDLPEQRPYKKQKSDAIDWLNGYSSQFKLKWEVSPSGITTVF